MKLGSLFILILMTLMGLSSFARMAQPTVLIIGETGTDAFDFELSENLILFYKKYLPDHNIIEISASPLAINHRKGVFRTKEEFLREELIEQIKAKIPSDALITHLIINTHGYYQDQRTELTAMGSFDNQGPDKSLQEFFNPLKNKISDQAVVVLNACSTFCGNTVDFQQRIEKLMNYLGAKNGSIYGSVTDDRGIAVELNSIIKSRDVKNSIFIGALLALMPSWFLHSYVLKDINYLAVYTAAFTASGLWSTMIQYLYLIKNSYSNKGYILKLKNGVVESISKKRKIFNSKTVYLAFLKKAPHTVMKCQDLKFSEQ